MAHPVGPDHPELRTSRTSRTSRTGRPSPRSDLPAAPRLAVGPQPAAGAAWTLRGAEAPERYATRAESDALRAASPPLGRREASFAALIPIRKSARWWALAHDERRAILEERSHHIAVGREYLPRVARRLYHARELGEPFDFLTWFEYGPADEPAFDELVARLRASEEWGFVEAEVDVRLDRPER